MLLGSIAALATYLLGASRLDFLSQLGIALLSGLGGGSVLANLMQKYEIGVLKAQMDGLEPITRHPWHAFQIAPLRQRKPRLLPHASKYRRF